MSRAEDAFGAGHPEGARDCATGRVRPAVAERRATTRRVAALLGPDAHPAPAPRPELGQQRHDPPR
ncbi:hypothetical protein, partial [Streptomyces sp. SID1034]|uniref:hypothetical protein n=1 Tax=Streptomyces sp. SID1034 TaxID=2690248 RepID=UPI001F4849E4